MSVSSEDTAAAATLPRAPSLARFGLAALLLASAPLYCDSTARAGACGLTPPQAVVDYLARDSLLQVGPALQAEVLGHLRAALGSAAGQDPAVLPWLGPAETGATPEAEAPGRPAYYWERFELWLFDWDALARQQRRDLEGARAACTAFVALPTDHCSEMDAARARFTVYYLTRHRGLCGDTAAPGATPLPQGLAPLRDALEGEDRYAAMSTLIQDPESPVLIARAAAPTLMGLEYLAMAYRHRYIALIFSEFIARRDDLYERHDGFKAVQTGLGYLQRRRLIQ